MSTLLRLILAFMLVIFFGPVSSNAQTDEVKMLEQAKLQLSAGKLYFATSWLERILKNYPKTLNREEVLLLLSKAYAASGRTERAAQTLRTLLKEYPKAAASLDSTLLKLAESAPQPEPVSRVIATPSAQEIPAGKKSASTSSAEQTKVAATAATTIKNVPKPAASPLINPAPPVIKPKVTPAQLTAPVESPVKKGTIPKASVPAAPNVESALSDKQPDKTTGTVTNMPKSAATPPITSTSPVSKPAAVPAPLLSPAKSTVKMVTTPPATVPATPNVENMQLAKKPNKAVETIEDIPKSAVAPPIQTTPPVSKLAAVPALLPAPANSSVKTVTTPPAAIPATPDVESSRLAVKPNKTKESVKYTLDIGEYVDKSAMIDTMNKINKAGLTPLLKQGLKKDQPMIRLFIGEFPDQKSVRKEQEKLRAVNIDSYVIKEGSKKFQVFVGAYLDQNVALMEQQRLSNLGINLSQKRVVVSVPTFLLTVGSFQTREGALEIAVELEKQGVKSSVAVQQPQRRLH